MIDRRRINRHQQFSIPIEQVVQHVGAEQQVAVNNHGIFAEAFDCTLRTVERLRIRLVERGLASGLEHGNRGKNRARKLDGVAEARLIALACGETPEGRNRWTVRLLADQIVVLEFVESCGKSTVQRVLKKTNLSLT